MRRTGNIVAGMTLSAGILAGCGAAYQAPAPTAPNGTVEQVIHNLDYSDVLGKLSLRQTVRLPAGQGVSLDVYDYTPATVDTVKLAKVVAFYATLADQTADQVRVMTIHPFDDKTSKMTNKTISATMGPRYDREHDFVLVPSDANLPRAFTNDGADSETDGMTEYYDTVSQTISVVKRPEDPSTYQPAGFLQGGALFTELCQATVNTTLTIDSLQTVSADDLPITERLVQETLCNGYGSAFEDAAQGFDYNLYASTAKGNIGTIDVSDNGTYEVDPYTIPPAEYTAIQQIVG